MSGCIAALRGPDGFLQHINTCGSICMYIRFQAGWHPLRFRSRHERHGLQTAQAAALGNTAIYLADRKTCATLSTTAVRTVVISSDPVAAILSLLKLHCCDFYYIGSYVLLMKS